MPSQPHEHHSLFPDFAYEYNTSFYVHMPTGVKFTAQDFASHSTWGSFLAWINERAREPHVNHPE